MYDNSSKKILIIEDDRTYRDPLSSFLAARSYNVSMAEDGEQAMEKLLFHRPDLVILDLLLPKVDGFEVLNRIRTYPQADVSATPVIILSNLHNDKDIEKAQASKITAYFVKSQTNFEDVYKKVKETISGGANGEPDEVMDFRKME